MSDSIATTHAHHVTLTVSDIERSTAFYKLLGFEYVADYGPRAVLGNNSMLLVLAPPPDPAQAIANDRFNENRIGLDHLSLNVATRGELDTALVLLSKHNVPVGEIKPLEPFGIAVLAFRDPDNIQIELTSPLS